MKNKIKIFTFILLLFSSKNSYAVSYSDYRIFYDHEQSHGYNDLEKNYDQDDFAEDKKDPFELINRMIFSFNMSMDITFLEPITNMYRYAVPEKAKTHLNYFFQNLNMPIVFTNDILQGSGQKSLKSFWRFVINSTIGIFGIFDVATELNLPYEPNSFSRTLTKLKIPSGPYVMLPILGPSTVTNAVGTITDSYVDYRVTKPLGDFRKGLRVAKLINLRNESFGIINDIKYNSIDPYVSMRSMYLQNKLNNLDEE